MTPQRMERCEIVEANVHDGRQQAIQQLGRNRVHAVRFEEKFRVVFAEKHERPARSVLKRHGADLRRRFHEVGQRGGDFFAGDPWNERREDARLGEEVERKGRVLVDGLLQGGERLGEELRNDGRRSDAEERLQDRAERESHEAIGVLRHAARGHDFLVAGPVGTAVQRDDGFEEGLAGGLKGLQGGLGLLDGGSGRSRGGEESEIGKGLLVGHQIRLRFRF